LNLTKQIGRKREEATALGNLGISYLDGDPAYALGFFELSLAAFQELGDTLNESTTLSNMSFGWVKLEDDERASHYAQLSLAAREQDALTTNSKKTSPLE